MKNYLFLISFLLLFSKYTLAQKDSIALWGFEIAKSAQHFNDYKQPEINSEFSLKYYLTNNSSLNLNYGAGNYSRTKLIDNLDFIETNFFQELSLGMERQFVFYNSIYIMPSYTVGLLMNSQTKSSEIGNNGMFIYENAFNKQFAAGAQLKVGFLFYNRFILGLKSKYEISQLGAYQFFSYGLSLEILVNYDYVLAKFK